MRPCKEFKEQHNGTLVHLSNGPSSLLYLFISRRSFTRSTVAGFFLTESTLFLPFSPSNVVTNGFSERAFDYVDFTQKVRLGSMAVAIEGSVDKEEVAPLLIILVKQ